MIEKKRKKKRGGEGKKKDKKKGGGGRIFKMNWNVDRFFGGNSTI